MSLKTFYQAVTLGIVMVLLGLLLSWVFTGLKPELPPECANWDQKHVMEISLFSIGFILRYLLTDSTFRKYTYDP